MYVKMMSDEKHAISQGKIKPILIELFPCYYKKNKTNQWQFSEV